MNNFKKNLIVYYFVQNVSKFRLLFIELIIMGRPQK